MGRLNIDLVGKKFGKLIALVRQGSDTWGNAIWECQCECGKVKKVISSSLISGNTQSCGCLQKSVAARRAKRCVGDKNPNWAGGVTPVARRIRKSEGYKNWRTAVFKRDNFICQECGTGGKLHAHHIKTFAAFPELRFEISNGQTLCVPCHKKTPSYLRHCGKEKNSHA